MLAQVTRAAKGGKPIVFFGWRPHPMNVNIDMDYLTDGDNVFGPDDGAAEVLTNTRPGYSKDCPNVGRFLANLAFSVEAEDLMMSYVLDDGMSADAAAEKWLKANPDVLDGWLDGVTTRDGQPGAAAVRQGLGLEPPAAQPRAAARTRGGRRATARRSRRSRCALRRGPWRGGCRGRAAAPP